MRRLIMALGFVFAFDQFSSAAEKIDAEIVCENRLVDDVANDLGMRQWMAILAVRDVTKGIKSQIKSHRHVAHC